MSRAFRAVADSVKRRLGMCAECLFSLFVALSGSVWVFAFGFVAGPGLTNRLTIFKNSNNLNLRRRHSTGFPH